MVDRQMRYRDGAALSCCAPIKVPEELTIFKGTCTVTETSCFTVLSFFCSAPLRTRASSKSLIGTQLDQLLFSSGFLDRYDRAHLGVLAVNQNLLSYQSTPRCVFWSTYQQLPVLSLYYDVNFDAIIGGPEYDFIWQLYTRRPFLWLFDMGFLDSPQLIL